MRTSALTESPLLQSTFKIPIELTCSMMRRTPRVRTAVWPVSGHASGVLHISVVDANMCEIERYVRMALSRFARTSILRRVHTMWSMWSTPLIARCGTQNPGAEALDCEQSNPQRSRSRIPSNGQRRARHEVLAGVTPRSAEARWPKQLRSLGKRSDSPSARYSFRLILSVVSSQIHRPETAVPHTCNRNTCVTLLSGPLCSSPAIFALITVI